VALSRSRSASTATSSSPTRPSATARSSSATPSASSPSPASRQSRRRGSTAPPSAECSSTGGGGSCRSSGTSLSPSSHLLRPGRRADGIAPRRIVGGELESIGSNALMALWMKHQVAVGAETWSVPNINYFPQGATAVSVVALLGTAVWTDWNGKRHLVNLLIATVMVVSAVLILLQDKISQAGALPLPVSASAGLASSAHRRRATRPSPPSPRRTYALSSFLAGIFFAFYIAGVSYAGQGASLSPSSREQEQVRALELTDLRSFPRSRPPAASNFAWANDLCRHDNEERAIVLGASSASPSIGSSSVLADSPPSPTSRSEHEHVEQRLQRLVVDPLLPCRPRAQVGARYGASSSSSTSRSRSSRPLERR